MVAKIVIGANFGDEGKGLMTDYFCHQSALRGDKCLVVLHNGGAQRGHTVVTPDGKKHIFHHFGSGTFIGADTYFSDDFILNPIIFRQEWEDLEEMGFTPLMYANENCLITTPFDMILNQIKEKWRGRERHGSCGIGIYETKIRTLYNFEAGIWKQLSKNELIDYLKKIRDEYFMYTIDFVGFKVPEDWLDIVSSENLINVFAEDMMFMFSHMLFKPEKEIFKEYDCLIFENGQGILLDQNNNEYYPHLTPSNTGIKNPLRIISKMDCKPNIEACYVTRTYLTRHGAGRLDGECDKAAINPDMQDLTNVPNPHQGTLRYAKLVEKSLEGRILKDFEPAKKYGAKLSLAVTHENEYSYVFSDKFKKNFDCIYYFDGETRESFRKDPDESKRKI